MRVSLNEIQVICRKAFEGIGFAPGDCDDAAEMIAWLQLQGLDGIGALKKALAFLHDEVDRPIETCYEDAAQLTLDAHGQSVLRCAAQAVELGVGKALRSGSALIRIRHCHNRILLLGYLARCAEQGLNFCVYWRDARQEMVATLSAGQTSPSLRVQALPDTARSDEQSINVLISRHFTLLPRLSAEGVEPDLAVVQPSLARKLAGGLEVDDEAWARLKKLGEQVLVESTEESRRRGAGESSDAR
ncbi:MAG: lactate dehydrogenase [Pseudomonas sp.]|nr:lactate dehydrogenase [Pseudomonas sp.]